MSTVRRKFEQARDRAAALASQAERTEAEEQEMIDQLDRAEELKAELAEIEARNERIAALGDVSRAINIPGQVLSTSTPQDLSVGEYLVAAAGLLNGTVSQDEFLDRAAKYHDRATNVFADTAAIVPEQIVGPIIDTYDSMRKVWNSFQSRSMPSSGKTFERPRVTQHVSVGEQLTEAAALASQKFTLTSDTVTKRTFGGTLELTRQDIDWTEPSILGLVVADFAKVYARFTEAAAVTHLTGLATAPSAYVATNLTTVVDSYVDGALAVQTALDDDVPLTLWMDTATAASHTKPVGSDNQTEWSVIEQALNAIGGVRVVVSRRLPADTRIMGAGELVEAYEQMHGLLSVVKPTNLTTDISYSGYAAFHGIASGFVSIEAA